MQIVVLYLVTLTLFLATDVVGLRYIVAPVYERHLGDLLLESPRILPAAAFYLFYIAALLWLVSFAGLKGAALSKVALNAAIFGAAAYGTYEFTNLATLRSWSWAQVWTDLVWGTALTAFSATAGLWITKTVTA